MSDGPTIDLFVEDQGHEGFLTAMSARLLREAGKRARVRPISARGGRPRVFDELKVYRRELERQIVGRTRPDILVVAIDCNCNSFAHTRREVLDTITTQDFPRVVLALPDPHVERWYMADPMSFRNVIGNAPPTVRAKCAKDRYKQILRSTIVKAGQPAPLGGVEFALELVEAMDLNRAMGRIPELGRFISDMKKALLQLP